MPANVSINDERIVSQKRLENYFNCSRCREKGKQCGYQKKGPCVECLTARQKCDKGEAQRLLRRKKIGQLADAVNERADGVRLQASQMTNHVRTLLQRIGDMTGKLEKTHKKMVQYRTAYEGATTEIADLRRKLAEAEDELADANERLTRDKEEEKEQDAGDGDEQDGDDKGGDEEEEDDDESRMQTDA
ncbi:hypothetical protein CYLTODRAFT_495051 [Cylindrobasidium torrendii FP15055 ss-10]|uniref:Zn(2)-C6 fungal-type domain-containing protein n=1 Tax=Cylindrobasidium torrendii FP15055 ss-10 TaxID=1314674 RepID=A0A0D7AUB4_9AGAR|nr:hypothetical protein CYLTODRAFT_495051 [Cylindrobasidium torrendii FP15055 ss-10]